MSDPMEPMPRRPLGPTQAEERRWRRVILARNLMVLAVVVLVGGLLAVCTYSVVVIRETQVTNVKRTANSNRTLAAIEDCTQPAGECFKRGQRRTAGAVADINRVVILAAACSVGLPSDLTVGKRQSEIQQCVIDRLALTRTGGP